MNRLENFIYLCLKIATQIEILIIFTILNVVLKKIYRGEYFSYQTSFDHRDQATGPIDLKF